MLDDRLLVELALLEKYQKKHRSLKEFIIIDDDVLKIKFRLSVKKHEYEFKAIYNRFFPYQPIEVLALTKFYTPHKYKNGAMCLKYGPDNWRTNITLVDLISNLYELLYLENPLGKKHAVSPSGDDFTFGQKVRNMSQVCMILPIHPQSFPKKIGILKATIIDATKFSFFIREIDGKKFCDGNGNATEYKYYISDIPYVNEDASYIRDTLNIDKTENVIVLYLNGHFSLLLANDNKNRYFDYAIGDYETKNRLDINKETLDKKITIIGLGSVGSRVAIDLARAGYKRFFLVDDDIFMPCNLIRHELTNKDFGKFKVEAVKDLICAYINNEASIEISMLAMTGQESSSATQRFLTLCSDSDIIIDCTGCDSLLFLLNKMTLDTNIAVLSGTVIPGGLGNIILYKKRNSKIGLESILGSYYSWKSDKNIFGERINDYSSNINDQPYIATMSDCSILSGLLGRYALDILHNRENGLENINVFSTSDFRDLKESYQVYKVKANNINRNNETYDASLLNKGRIVYENNSLKKSFRKNNKKA